MGPTRLFTNEARNLGKSARTRAKLMDAAVDAVPACAYRHAMQQLVRKESERLVPQSAYEQIQRQVAGAELKANA